MLGKAKIHSSHAKFCGFSTSGSSSPHSRAARSSPLSMLHPSMHGPLPSLLLAGVWATALEKQQHKPRAPSHEASHDYEVSSWEGTMAVSVLFCEWRFNFKIVCGMCFSGSYLCGNLGGLASKSGLSYIWANLEVKSKYCLNARSRFSEGTLLHVMCRASALVGIVLAQYWNFTSIIVLHLWLHKDVPIETSESLTWSYLLVNHVTYG